MKKTKRRPEEHSTQLRAARSVAESSTLMITVDVVISLGSHLKASRLMLINYLNYADHLKMDLVAHEITSKKLFINGSFLINDDRQVVLGIFCLLYIPLERALSLQ